MKNALFALLVIDMLLLFGAGVRLMGAKTVEPSSNPGYVSPSSRRAAAESPAADGAATGAAADQGNAGRFVDAMNTTGGSDVPPGMEGVVGGNRPTYEVDIEGNPQADNEAAMDDARAKIGALGGKP